MPLDYGRNSAVSDEVRFGAAVLVKGLVQKDPVAQKDVDACIGDSLILSMNSRDVGVLQLRFRHPDEWYLLRLPAHQRKPASRTLRAAEDLQARHSY